MAAAAAAEPYSKVRKEYDDQATSYNALLDLPFGVLESQLFSAAVGGGSSHCKDAVVLDLGGGTGLRARETLAAGAARVDVVDISAEMMAVGKKDADLLLGPERSATRLHWFPGDASKPLFGNGGVRGVRGLGPAGSYDLVLGNWLFDHVDDVAVLETIWRNVAAALKPGGRFVGVRAADPRCEAMTTGKYGPTCQDFREEPECLYYSSTIPSSSRGPPTHLSNASLKVSYTGSTEMHEKHGFVDVEIEPPEKADLVRSDPDFWRSWVEKPGFVVVKARKA